MELLIQLVVFLVIGGLIYYLVTLLPLPEPIKTIVMVLMVLILIIFLLNAMGTFGGFAWRGR